MNIILSLTAAAALATGAPSPAPQVPDSVRPLSLDQAVHQALSGNRSLAAARALAEGAHAGARGASAFAWPALGLEAAAVRTNDPVGVFGARLRQGTFAAPDLDLGALNHPDPVTDWSGALGVRWAILDPSAWAGRDAARGQAEAADWTAARRADVTEFRARALYVEALRTHGRLEAADAAVEAADATLELFRRRRDEGVLTDADALQAEAERQAALAARIQARQADLDARSRLAVFLGWDDGALPLPTDTLTAPAASAGTDPAAPDPRLEQRADLKAMEAGARVARDRARQASWVRLPAVEAFGRGAVHSASLDQFEDNWTVGVQLRWPLFTGFGAQAGKDQALQQARAAELERQQSLSAARAELAEARRGVTSAARTVDATRAALEAADEARRLVNRRFQEGMATTVDLLQAEARRVEMRARTVDALALYQVAEARLHFVSTIHDRAPQGNAPTSGDAGHQGDTP